MSKIQLHELRLGNYVDFVIKGATSSVTSISEDGTIGTRKINSNLDNADRYLYDLLPIQLNENELIKFGLGNNKGQFQFNNDRYVIIKMSNAYTLFLNKIDEMELITGFNYVHELQNIHFDLTGKLLFYKP